MIEEQEDEPAQPLPTARMLRRRNRRLKLKARNRHGKLGLLIGLIFAGFLAIAALYSKHFTLVHYSVALNGKPIVSLNSRKQCEDVIQQLKMKYSPDFPQAVIFVEGRLTVEPVKKAMSTTNTQQALKTLSGRLTPQLSGVVIRVNGIPLAMLASKADAAQAIEIIQQTAARDGGIPTFKERVLITAYKQKLTKGKSRIPVMTPDQAARELYHPPQPQFITIRNGDNLYKIATEHKITVKQLKQLNPDVDPGALKVGDQLRLPDQNSPITVVIR